jgi:TolB-like protein
MSDNPGKLSQFWQELKRRKVIYVITVYASAAFVIIELVNNVLEPLNLPDRTPTIAIIVLAIGFPLAIILSWIFDMTPKGVEKTKPLTGSQEGEKSVIANRWKIATYVSIAVIIGLIILNLAGGTKQLRAGDIQSLVVLPFDNFTGDDQLEYFVSGMHASLIGDMGKIGGLRVISKTSSNIYKDIDMSVPEIASELNVDAVVEAQVMCLGDSICLQVKVVSAFPEEKQLWIADYMVEKSQILNLYNRITKQIADEVMIELTADEESLLAEATTVDKEAYDAFLRGHYYWGGDLSEESLIKALEYLNIAIEKDPGWAPPYAGVAQVWAGLAQMGFASPEIAGPKIYENINKALELDPDFADSHFINGIIAVWTEWDWEKGEKEFLHALSINPNDAMSRIYYAHLLMSLQRPDEALSQGQRAVDLDPLNSLIQALYAVVLTDVGNWEVAFEYCEKSLALDPGSFFASNVMEIVAYHLERYEELFEAQKIYLPLDDNVMNDIEKIFNEQGFNMAFEEVVRQMELLAQNNYVPPVDMAIRYYLLNQHEKAMNWLEKGFELHDPNMPYIAVGFANLNELYENPRFLAILEKMNLPLKDE